MVIKGFMLHFGIEILYELEPMHTSNHNQELADAFIHKMAALKIKCQQNIHYTQKHMTEQINHHQNPVLNYQVKDMMWLNTQNIHNSQHPVNKLNIKVDEFFWIIQKININAYKLELLFYWKIHNVFNIIHIQQVHNNPFLNQSCPISFESDFDKKFEVEKVLNSNMHKGCFMWLIKWTDFNEFIWHQLSDLIGCDEALEHFYNCYPDKPGKAHWHE